MTEDVLSKMIKKEKVFFFILFLILAIVTVSAFLSAFGFGFVDWIWIIATIIYYIWSKDFITGLKWSETLVRPKTVEQSSSSPCYDKNNEQHHTKIVANSPSINESEKQGYITLAKLCLAPHKRDEFLTFCETLRDISSEENDMTRLDYVMEHCKDQNLYFIISLDWKSEIENLEWRLWQSLRKNFNQLIALPDLEDYGQRASVSHEGVFADFDKPLRKVGLQMGFIDTQSDQYIIVVHKSIDKQAVADAVKLIGYSYYETVDIQ